MNIIDKSTIGGLTQEELDLINKVEQIPMQVSGALSFDISQIVEPLGGTKVELEDETTEKETVSISLSSDEIQELKDEIQVNDKLLSEIIEEYETKMKQVCERTDIDTRARKRQLLEIDRDLSEKYSVSFEIINRNRFLIDNNGKTIDLPHIKAGRYVHETDTIKLYMKPIDKAKGWGIKRSDIIISTLVQGLFNAFFRKQASNQPVLEIDEAMVGFSKLAFLKYLASIDSDYAPVFDYAYDGVKSNKNKYGIGRLVSYSFGALLYDSCPEPLAWIEAYYNGIGNINPQADDVRAYVNDLSPIYTKDEERTYSLLSGILFGGKVMPIKKGNATAILDVHKSESTKG